MLFLLSKGTTVNCFKLKMSQHPTDQKCPVPPLLNQILPSPPHHDITKSVSNMLIQSYYLHLTDTMQGHQLVNNNNNKK